jgi:PAS domain S-box-containing protein
MTDPAENPLQSSLLGDETYRRLAEELIAVNALNQAILNSALDAIIAIDERGLIQTFNPAAERIFGYSLDEVKGKNVAMLMPAPYRDEHDGYIDRYKATGDRKIIGIGREVTGLRKDGSTFPMELAVNEAFANGHRFFAGTIRDISERRRTENDLRRSNAELEKALADLHAKTDELHIMTQQLWQTAKLATLGELAASIAHDLNNPLATISLRVEAILAVLEPDNALRRPLEIIETEVERMGNLVADILQFSRRGQERISSLNINEELQKALELIRYQLRQRGIEAVIDVAPNLPPIHADRQKLRQVFLNLLTNASDAMHSKGVLSLRAASAMMPSGEPAVMIEIADTGTGIPPDLLVRIMEPFFTTKSDGKGTGLGLPICRRIIQEHRGTIEIKSEVGNGTLVRLLLPIQKTHSGTLLS